MYTHTHTYVYWNITYDSGIKKNEILPVATTWMNLKDIMLGEMSHKGRQNLVCCNFYVEHKKQNKQIYITKQKQTHRYREQTSINSWGEGMVRIGVGDSGIQTTVYKID